MLCIIVILISATNWLFIGYAYNIYVFFTMKHVISKITVNELTRDQLALINDQLALINNQKTLPDFRSGYINMMDLPLMMSINYTQKNLL